MLTVSNVSLVKESSNPAVYLVVGDSKFWVVNPAEFEALGFQWSKILVVEDGALAHLVEKRLHAAPVTRPSDVFFDCGTDFDSITGRWHFNCKNSSSIVGRDVLVAGWLRQPSAAGDPVMPFINIDADGIEDIHYNLVLDAVFLDRLYGPNGLSSRQQGAMYPGNPTDAIPLRFAAGPPLVAGSPTTVNYNSWILPGNDSDLHGELNAWHKYNTGSLFTRHFVGRGNPPAFWINPFPDDVGAYFPFHPLNPDAAPTNLGPGDYVIMRGPLWQDFWHGDSNRVLDPWDSGPTRHHAWLEMHPIDYIVRLQQPGANARLTAARIALCTPEITGPQLEWGTTIMPGFTAAPSRHLLVRTVERLDDLRMGMIVPGSLAGVHTNRQSDRVDINVSVVPTGTSQGRYKGSWLVGWSEVDDRDNVWVDDGLPAGSQEFGSGEGWNWQSLEPIPFHGVIAHQSAKVAGIHQHYFESQSTLAVGAGDTLFSMVYLDPDDPPDEVMLQWRTTDWLHRAYWGKDLVGWGTPGTSQRRPMGRLPVASEWVRLEVPAQSVGLEGKTLTGLAFTLWGGKATWDYAGVRVAVPKSGRLAITVSPSSVREGRRTITIWTRDSGDRSLVAGRVLLEGQDIAATNTPFARTYSDEPVEFIVRCVEYPEAVAHLSILPTSL